MEEVIDLLKNNIKPNQKNPNAYMKKHGHQGDKVKVFDIGKTPYTGLVANKNPCMVA